MLCTIVYNKINEYILYFRLIFVWFFKCKKEQDIDKIKMQEKNIRRQEKKMMMNIQKLPKVLVCHIYDYLSYEMKFYYNPKYEFLEKNVKNDCRKSFVFWKQLRDIFEPLNKKQLLQLLYKNINKNYPYVIDRLWYHSHCGDSYYTGYKLLELWEIDKLDIPNKNLPAIDHTIKFRIIDAIYFYIIRSVEMYDTNKKKWIRDNKIIVNPIVFQNINSSIRLYKSIYYIKSKLYNK
jgi:hypothetical protein